MLAEENKVAEQKAAEAAVEGFSKNLGPFVAAAKGTRMPMVFTDAKASGNPIIFANDRFISLTGYPREEVLGQSFGFLMARDADANALAAIEEAFRGNKSGDDPEIRYRRKDGSTFWATVFISPVHDEHGNTVQHFASFMNTTQHKEEQDRLRFLLDELNHRTQNTLATVLGIATQTLHGVDQAVVAAFEGRILALSKAQSLLGHRNWEDVGVRDLMDQILEPFGLTDRRAIHFAPTGDNVRLQPKTALTLAMVFHELATNAIKHGALSTGGAGLIEISWQVEETPLGDRMRFRWLESGGPPVTQPSRSGFGSRLIEHGLAKDLDGEVRLDYAPDGVSCQIVMPVPGGNMNER